MDAQKDNYEVCEEELKRTGEIAEGLNALCDALFGGSLVPDLSVNDLAEEEHDDFQDYVCTRVTDEALIQKYNLSCVDWLSFNKHQKSADKYAQRVEDFIMWRENNFTDLSTTPHAMATSLIEYFNAMKTLTTKEGKH